MKLKILLPTDLSDNSWNAMVYALHMFKDTPCVFYILHSYKITASSMSNISNKLMTTLKEKAADELYDYKCQLQDAKINPEFEFEIILSSRDLLDAVNVAVEDYLIDYIVMGTKGASKTKGFFYGSHTVKVLNKVKTCPVLIVPENYEFTQIHQIVFPTDYNRFYDDKELRPFKVIASLQNAAIKVLHINVETHLSDIQNYNKTMLNEYLNKYNHSFHWMPDYTNKVEEINTFIIDLNIDLLVMINYEHSLVESIFNEPIIKQISFKPRIPFLVIPGFA
jgi:nucleotide-binding universal stress UspA family protein